MTAEIIYSLQSAANSLEYFSLSCLPNNETRDAYEKMISLFSHLRYINLGHLINCHVNLDCLRKTMIK